MADPQSFSPDYSYTGFAVGQGDNSFPGEQLDTDFEAVRAAQDSLVSALLDVRRSDGTLKSGSVGFDQLRPELLDGMWQPALWQPATAFAAGAVVIYLTGAYRALVTHVSAATFAADAAKWQLALDLAPLRGGKGWSPVFAAVSDGERIVLQVTAWTGGEGEAPAVGGFVGAAGLVADAALAIDVRGPQGLTGATGDVTPAAEDAATRAELAAVAASALGKTYPSTAAAIADGALADQAYFMVVPAGAVYRKVSGAAVDTGFRYASGAAIDAEATARQDADATEVTARNTAITAAVGAETTAREAADAAEAAARAGAVAAEATARQDADAAEVTARNAAIVAAVGAEATARQDADAAEVTARNAAITTAVGVETNARQAAITAEAVAREAAIAVETADRIEDVLAEKYLREQAIAGEAATREAWFAAAADDRTAAIGVAVAAEAAERQAADAAEATARSNADAAEVVARNSAITVAVAGEAAARVGAVNAEAVARQAADAEEVSAREGLIDRDDSSGVVFSDPSGFVLGSLPLGGGLKTNSVELAVAAAANGIEFSDAHGFLLARFDADISINGGRCWSYDANISGEAYADGSGFSSVSFDPHGATIAGLRFEADPQEPSVVYCDGRGFLLYRMGEVTAEEVVPEKDPDASPLFSALLCGVTGEDLSIYARNLVPVRSDTDVIFGTVESTEALNRYSRTGQNELVVAPERLGASARVSMRGAALDVRITRSVTVKVADKSPAGPPTGKILMIGDSIVDRQGAFILKQQLEGWGYAPIFVGTLNGSSTTSSAGDELGPLGEGRGGWLTGDYTYTSTAQAVPVAAGDEALYLAMSKSDKHDRNPFIRLATGSDAAEVIRNGYVMDFEFYCTRFGVDTPDIVLYNLGTNDIRDIAAGEIYDAIYTNEMLTMARLRLAWPAAKIIRYLPGATRNVARDELWAQRYVPTIRAIMQAQKDLGDSKLYLAPTWAMVTSEVGYALASGTTDETTGAVTRTISDAVHPIGCARAQLYHAVAGYVACAMSGLI